MHVGGYLSGFLEQQQGCGVQPAGRTLNAYQHGDGCSRALHMRHGAMHACMQVMPRAAPRPAAHSRAPVEVYICDPRAHARVCMPT